MLYHLNPWTDTRQGVCDSFLIYRQNPADFFLQRFTGMTSPVAEMLSNRVFNVLEDANDDSARVSAFEFGVWAKDLPQLLQPHPILSQDQPPQGYASVSPLCHPLLPAPCTLFAINTPTTTITHLWSPPLDTIYEHSMELELAVDVRSSPPQVQENLQEVVIPLSSASSRTQTNNGLDLNDAIHWITRQEAPWRNIEYIPQALAQEVMNKLQSDLDLISSGDSEDRRRVIKCLRSLSTLYNILPAQLYLPASDLGERDNVMHAGGAFSDICRARYMGELVCLKILRIHSQGKLRMERVTKAFCQEALIWRQVSHRNILAFYGVSIEVFPGRLCFVSPWMEHGNINDFLESHPHHDRWQCLWDIAAGIEYLHGLDPCVIHKDIRGANILVGKDFRCCLADFGISLVAETQLPGTSTRNRGNIRWLPPELINESEFDPTLLKKVDIYSFGCTIVEVSAPQVALCNFDRDLDLHGRATVFRFAHRRRRSEPYCFEEAPSTAADRYPSTLFVGCGCSPLHFAITKSSTNSVHNSRLSAQSGHCASRTLRSMTCAPACHIRKHRYSLSIILFLVYISDPLITIA
ncbi:kinase-like protein [Hymenopellis radicata]|nr:kinase-like protein [Hymenopellis radicata]